MNFLLRTLYTGLIIIGIFLIIYYLINQEWFIKILIKIQRGFIYRYEKAKKYYKHFLKVNVFKEDSKFTKWYKKLLIYTKFSLEVFFNVKVILFMVTIVISILVKSTDIMIYTDEMYTKLKYDQDVISQYNEEIKEEDKPIILEYKQKLLKQALAQIDRKTFMGNQKDGVEDIAIGVIKGLGNPTPIPDESLANEVYYKLKKYYEVREINYVSYFAIAIFISCIPEILMFLYNFFVKVDAKKELSFMKRLIIMNGSIKPVDFMEVLKELIKKSTYYTKILEEIQDKNKKNYLPNTQIYLPYIRASKSLPEKLFFEKLDEANNYDFDQAIQNIKNEFELDKRTQTRKIKKTVEVIHIWGIVGYMALIVIIVLYLILPWMSAYSMDTMM